MVRESLNLGVSVLTDVWLGSRPGKSPWSEKSGRTYDIRTDTYGPSKYSIAANRKRIGRGTTGWICHRDGSFGAIAGLFVFDGGTEVHAELLFMTGLVFPLPREYWIDGARIQFNPKEQWEPAGPFKPWPNNYANGVAVSTSNAVVLRRQLHPVVAEWLERHTATASIQLP